MPLHPIEAPILADSQIIGLPAMRVSAGFPSPAGDDLEDEIDPIAWVVRHPASTFWWRVEGDSLWDVGIRDGDIIAVDRAGKRRLGRAVLAVVEGRSWRRSCASGTGGSTSRLLTAGSHTQTLN